MEDPWIITVTDRGKERQLKATLQVRGYTYRFLIMVEGWEVIFERDEEGRFRAVVSTVDHQKSARSPDPELLQAIAIELEALLA
ncbi:MAG: hypothetical protein ACYCOO_07750 [Chitinophagaceae bacterium]